MPIDAGEMVRVSLSTSDLMGGRLRPFTECFRPLKVRIHAAGFTFAQRSAGLVCLMGGGQT